MREKLSILPPSLPPPPVGTSDALGRRISAHGALLPLAPVDVLAAKEDLIRKKLINSHSEKDKNKISNLECLVPHVSVPQAVEDEVGRVVQGQ